MRNLALQNAIQHGHAHPKALMGKLLGQRADLRSAVPAVVEALERIVSEVNAMDSGERRSALDASAPEMLDAKPKNVRPQGLPDLPDRSGDVVLRFAPNPNGPLSFGHSRGVAINAAYAKRHGGTFILRFDDTDTVRKPPWIGPTITSRRRSRGSWGHLRTGSCSQATVWRSTMRMPRHCWSRAERTCADARQTRSGGTGNRNRHALAGTAPSRTPTQIGSR